MVDDLQRCAERVVGRPKAFAFAMHVENEASDRGRGIAAIVHQIVPVLVAVLGYIPTKRGQKIEPMLRAQLFLREDRAKRQCVRRAVRRAHQGRRQFVEPAELFLCQHARMVRDVVRGARKAIEGENCRAVPRRDDPRSHREILVRVALAGLDLGERRHGEFAACILPFHIPPRPRTCCQAESIVNTT